MQLSPIQFRASVFLMGVLLFFPITYLQVVLSQGPSDWALHAEFAQLQAVTGIPAIPHFLFATLLLLLRAVFRLPLPVGEIAIVTVLHAVLLLFITVLLEESGAQRKFALLGGALVLIFAPAFLLRFRLLGLYFGYLNPTIYHNPTFILLKPIALAHFLSVCAILNGKDSISGRVGCAALLALSAIAKPNYVLVLVPAVLIYIIIKRLQGQTHASATLISGVVVPGVIILALQLLFGYLHPIAGMGESRIIFAPFLAMQSRSNHLTLHFLLSIIFPVTASLSFWTVLKNQVDFRLSWLIFLAGCVTTYFFAETGVRFSHLNFIWGSAIGLFLLVFVLVRRLLTFVTRSENKVRALICYLALGLHILSGILWYWCEATAPTIHW
jgi:hypothetical protein